MCYIWEDIPDLKQVEEKVWEKTPEYLLEIIAKITTALLYRLNVSDEEVDEMVGQVKEKKMPVLFEHFEGYDVQATRKEAREEGRKEGIKVLIETYNEMIVSKEDAYGKVKEKFSLTDEETTEYFTQFWKEN